MTNDETLIEAIVRLTDDHHKNHPDVAPTTTGYRVVCDLQDIAGGDGQLEHFGRWYRELLVKVEREIQERTAIEPGTGEWIETLEEMIQLMDELAEYAND